MSSSAASGDADLSDAVATIPVICGPTASGKSALAMRIAERRAVTIVSADSRQVYRRFDVGTAKPSAEERRRVPHRGLDVVDATQRYSAAQWAELAHGAIREAIGTGRIPVIVGGTGFYMRALFRPLFAEPELDGARRAALQRLLNRMASSELRRWCEALDPARAHLGRAQLLRAVEVALLAGERLSDLHVRLARPRAWRARYLLLDPGPDLAARIAARAARMFEHGWPDEVRALIAEIPGDAPAWNATGYEVVRRFVLGEIGGAEALEQVVIETRQYAKRQRTWFRNQLVGDDVIRVTETAGQRTESIVEAWITEMEGGLENARSGGART